MMPNVLQYPVATAAVLRAGYAVVNVNPLYTPRELEHQLKDSGAEAIVVLENFATTVQQVLAKTAVKHVIVGSMGDLLGFKGVIVNLVVRRVKKMVPAYSIPGAVSFNDALAAGRGMKLNKPQLTPEDVAFLQYTGGTTGVSKGATLLHRNILANVLQNDAWLQPALKKPPIVDQMVIVCALPLYHIFALTACYLLGVRTGGTNLLIPNPRDMAGFIKELQKYQVSFFPAVNTLYNGLLNTPGFDKLDFSKLKISNGGGMATQKPVAEKWLKTTGCALSEGYGLSETSPTLTCNRADIEEFSGTIGLPVPSTYLSIRDDDGKELPLGEAGEICAKGPQVMAGYWNRPDETAKVMTADGYFRTGDIGVMDGERLHQDRRPQEGHDPGLRLQRLSERDRGSDREPSRRARMRRDRRAGREVGRSGQGLHRQEGPEPHAGDIIKYCTHAAHRLQGPEADRVQDRPAEDQCRQDPAPRTARREEGRGLSLQRRERLAMTDARDVAPADILAFWREAGPERWYKRDDAFDAEVRSRFLGAVAGGQRPASCRHGRRATTARWRWPSCSTSFPATCFAATPGPMSSDALAREVAGRAIARGADARIDPALLRIPLSCRSCIRSIWPTSCAASNCSGKPATPTT